MTKKIQDDTRRYKKRLRESRRRKKCQKDVRIGKKKEDTKKRDKKQGSINSFIAFLY